MHSTGNIDASDDEPLYYSEGAKLPSNAPAWAVAASERLKKRRENGYRSSCNPPTGVTKVLLHSCCAPCRCVSRIFSMILFHGNITCSCMVLLLPS